MSSNYDEDNFVQRYADRFNLKIDGDWSYREARLFILQKFLNGTIYDNLEPFYKEYNGEGDGAKYIQLAKRRPSVIYKLPKIIVDASVSMLFGEGHFPIPRCEGDHAEGDKKNDNTTKFLQYITRVCDLRGTMIDAARKGSVGSSIVLVSVLEGKFHFQAIHSIHCVPVFKAMNPHELESLTEKKKVDGHTLLTKGYSVPKDDLKETFYIMRRWTDQAEIYYKPYKAEKEDEENFVPEEDADRSSIHGFGFVPAIWMKNLPKSGNIDGHGTFEDIIDICIEIDYQLSQHGRLLKYNSDPTLVIKNPTSLDGQELVKGTGALNLDEKGEAYYLQLTDGATKAVMEYVKGLREIGLEMVRGNRSNPDKVHTAASGEALKMLNFELVSLVEEMRITYGEYGLLKVYQMVPAIIANGGIEITFDESCPKPSTGCEGHIMLDWPAWYPPTALDKMNEATTLTTLTQGSLLSKETATKSIADEYQILDLDDELKAIEKEAQDQYDKDAELAKANKPNSVVPKPKKKVAPSKGK